MYRGFNFFAEIYSIKKNRNNDVRNQYSLKYYVAKKHAAHTRELKEDDKINY